MFSRNLIDDANGTEHDSSGYVNTNYSVDVEEYVPGPRPRSPTLEQALTTYVVAAVSHPVQSQRTEHVREDITSMDLSSRVTIAVGKYPNDATLHDYGALQRWMYTHTNKHAPSDVCQSLTRIVLLLSDRYNHHILFNVYLTCAEVLQTIGKTNKSNRQLHQAEIIANILDNSTTITDPYEIAERERKRSKTKDIRMKLKFQSDFESHLNRDQNKSRSSAKQDDFLRQLHMENPSPEYCRSIWREIVLQCVCNPDIAILSSQWLFLYAQKLDSHSISHANALYVAVNLLLFGCGSTFSEKHPQIDVFKILDDIGRYFEENGNQSKQFSPIHKMAHVWGTAAVAFYFRSEEYKYLVCASIMRVSFESLGVSFLSSGIESLYILARKHAPQFFLLMANDPNIKLIYPDCLNYFRRKLETVQTCIRYSSEIVDQFVAEVFNIDATDYRI